MNQALGAFTRQSLCTVEIPPALFLYFPEFPIESLENLVGQRFLGQSSRRDNSIDVCFHWLEKPECLQFIAPPIPQFSASLDPQFLGPSSLGTRVRRAWCLRVLGAWIVTPKEPVRFMAEALWFVDAGGLCV
jgi:hypothetical protein